MKKLAVILGVIFFAGSVFSCPKITGISFEPSFEVPVGTNVTATMLIQEVLDYQIDICTWGGDFSGLEQTSGLTLSSPQTYSADASIHWSGVDENGKIVSGTDTYSQTLVAYCVNTVTEDKQVIAKGSSDTITITAGVYPSVTGDVGSFIQWEMQKDGGEWLDAGTGMSQTLDSSEAGTYYYRARAGDNDTWVVSDKLTVFSINFLDVAVENNDIHYFIAPDDATLSGTLKLSLTGTGAVINNISTETIGGGDNHSGFDIDNLQVGEYTKVKAAFTVGNDKSETTIDYHIRVLGKYRQSQYNTPHESDTSCGGVPTKAYITDGSCNFASSSLKSNFRYQINIEGSGVSINYGNICRESWCFTHGTPPPDAANISFRQNCGPNGSCNNNTGRLGSDTVAINPGHTLIGCDDRIYINGLGIKTVTDTGGGVGTAQLDNYNPNIYVCGEFAPSQLPDLSGGNRMCIKLY